MSIQVGYSCHRILLTNQVLNRQFQCLNYNYEVQNMDYLNVILNDLNFVNKLIRINYQNLGMELFNYKTINPFNTEKINCYKNFIKDQINNCNEILRNHHYRLKPIKQNQINFNINRKNYRTLILYLSRKYFHQ